MLFKTISGKMLNLNALNEDDICIEDIAHALSMICRYSGHVNRFYSVAEHSINVAALVPQHLKAQALLHDASEAYLGDVSAPLKELLPQYVMIEKRVQKIILNKFGLPIDIDKAVLKADIDIRQAEMAILFKATAGMPLMRRPNAKKTFLDEIERLLNGIC